MHRQFVMGIIIAILGSGSSRLLANDNFLGFPAPQDPAKPGIVMLHGGGRASDDVHRAKVRKKFVELAAEAEGEARIVLIPSDTCVRGMSSDDEIIDGGETREQYEAKLSSPEQYGRWARTTAKSFQFAYRDSVHDPHDKKICEAIRGATGVWIPAHDQEWLPELFADEYFGNVSPVVSELRNLLARGGVIGGLAGGAACLPETIIAKNDEESESSGGWIKPKLRFGLGLMTNVVVDTNFQRSGRLERLTHMLTYGDSFDEQLSRPGVRPTTVGIGVTRFAVAILRPDSIEAFSDSEKTGIDVFMRRDDGRTLRWLRLQSGEKVRLTAPESRPAVTLPGKKNPFGLPTVDGMPAGTVVLHGGGDTDAITKELPRLADQTAPFMVHCPVARDRFRPIDEEHKELLRPQIESHFFEWRNQVRFGNLSGLEFLITNDSRDAEKASFVAPLRKAGAVWFSGGNQWMLRDLFVGKENKPTLFQKELRKVLERGGVVGGTSAGLAIMPNKVIVKRRGGADDADEKDEADERKDEKEVQGFGLLANVLADQHFNARQGRIQRISERLWKQDGKLFGIAVDEDTALIVTKNTIRVHGDGLAHVFMRSRFQGLDTLEWHMLRPEDRATVQNTDDGFQLELASEVEE